jgi:methylenetetrahydrofolate dehydrogenase (NADP+)/methenyltetrahydrofolate cyclohydrolase
VLIVAAGRPGLIGAGHVTAGQTVIDAGISFVDGKMAGDVDGDAVAEVVAALSPVPGGVGPLTSTLIFANLLRAMALQGFEEPGP